MESRAVYHIYMLYMYKCAQTRDDASSLEGTTLEGYLAHHRDMILLTAVEEAKQLSEEYIQETQRRWVTKEWEEAKKEFMESLGHRAHKWGSIHASETKTKVYEPVELAAIGAPPSASKALIPVATPSLSPLFKVHVDTVRLINQTSHASSGHPKVLAFDELLKSSKALDQTFLSQNDSHGYQTLLEVLSCMAGEDLDPDAVAAPGQFSSLCVEQDDVQRTVQQLHARLTSGAKRFFEHQVMHVWMNKLSEVSHLGGVEVGARDEGATLHARLCNYVLYLCDNGVIPHDAGVKQGFISPRGRAGPDAPPLWALVYYCLRSGNIDIAVKELTAAAAVSSMATIREGASSVATILQAILDISASKDADLVRVDARQLEQAMKDCKSLYENGSSGSNQADPFKAFVLNLVGLKDKRDLAAPNIPQYKFEDFLWAHLWFMSTSATLQKVIRKQSLGEPFHSPFKISRGIGHHSQPPGV